LRSRYTGEVFDHPIVSIEAELAKAGVPVTEPQSAFLETLGKVAGRLRLSRNVRQPVGLVTVVPLMGLEERRLFPRGLVAEVVPICFDCWEPDYPRWTSFFRRYRVHRAYFTARQSASHFRVSLGMDARWLPEATVPEDYSRGPLLRQRTIDVLELGRRFAHYHAAVAEDLARAHYRHLFEPKPRTIIFPSRAELVAALADTKISICFPSSTTNPERSGAVETLTHRYLEAMASRSLPLGQAPKELIELFGYDPVIPWREHAPAAQLIEVLEAIDDYQDLVERNLRRLLDVGTWSKRIQWLLHDLHQADPAAVTR